MDTDELIDDAFYMYALVLDGYDNAINWTETTFAELAITQDFAKYNIEPDKNLDNEELLDYVFMELLPHAPQYKLYHQHLDYLIGMLVNEVYPCTSWSIADTVKIQVIMAQYDIADCKVITNPDTLNTMLPMVIIRGLLSQNNVIIDSSLVGNFPAFADLFQDLILAA